MGLYLIVGVIGTALTAQFHHHLELRVRKPYRSAAITGLAWAHLVLMNVGAAAAVMLMIYSGYFGDFALSPRESGGFGMTTVRVAVQILNPFIVPIARMLLITVVSDVAGEVGFVLNYFSKGK